MSIHNQLNIFAVWIQWDKCHFPLCLSEMWKPVSLCFLCGSEHDMSTLGCHKILGISKITCMGNHELLYISEFAGLFASLYITVCNAWHVSWVWLSLRTALLCDIHPTFNGNLEKILDHKNFYPKCEKKSKSFCVFFLCSGGNKMIESHYSSFETPWL